MIQPFPLDLDLWYCLLLQHMGSRFPANMIPEQRLTILSNNILFSRLLPR
jgi:hypothetical protein